MTKPAVLDDPIETLAVITHNANKALCEATGDDSQVEWEECDDELKDSVRAGIKLILEGNGLSAEEVHQAWMDQKAEDGWTVGEVKDEEAKTHPSMVPYDKLPGLDRYKDYLFRSIVESYKQFDDEDRGDADDTDTSEKTNSDDDATLSDES